jgi:hypothetical protein
MKLPVNSIFPGGIFFFVPKISLPGKDIARMIAGHEQETPLREDGHG